MKRIVMASASPRRRELIKLITDNVICVSSGEDETLPEDIATEEVPVFLAAIKAQSVASEYPDDIVVGCDTVVVLDSQILSKPSSQEDAYDKLRTLSGRVHKVITGCALVESGRLHTFSEVTEVEFHDLDDSEINAYIATGSPMDKAGGYGIQDKGAMFVKGIRGDYFNVVGLPVASLYRALKNFE